MQVVFLGNYVFWAWNLGLNKDSHFWIPEVVHENAILNKNRLRHTVQHYKAFQSNFYVMMDTDSDTVCCVYDLYDVYNKASKAIPDVNFDAQ